MKVFHTSLAFIALLASCAVPSLDVMPRYGTLDVDGNFGVRDTSGGGDLALADLGTAGFSKDDGVIGLRADLDFGAPRVMVSAQSSNHDGSGTLTADLTNGSGDSISAGSPVDSTMELGLYQGIVTWDLFPGDMGELGIGLGVVGVDLDASVTDTSPGGDKLDVSEFAPIPVLALRGGVKVGDFEVSGMLDGMKASLSYDDIGFIDLDLFARYAFFGGEDRMRFSAGLGYRYVNVDVESNEDGEEIALDMAFSGPYLLLQFSI